MKTNQVRLIGLLFVMVATLTSACNYAIVQTSPSLPATNTPEVIQEETVEEVATEVVVLPPPTLVSPTEVVAERFFTDEFDVDRGDWDFFYVGDGDSEKISITHDDSYLKVDFDEMNMYMYSIYTPHDYESVRVTMSAENRGRNNNNVSLVCNYSDIGWYEFSVESGGLWYVYAYIADASYEHPGYNVIANGGARSLKQGKEVNEYALECDGNELTLWVNDVELQKVRDPRFALTDGKVGFNISSLNVLPITVNLDWFRIEQP